MAGYIGSKAVLLSTTAATVTGAADIGGDLTVDTNTLYVDSTNNNVGIGTSSPNSSSRLHVEGGAAEQVQIRVSQSDNTGVFMFSQSSSAGLWNADNTDTLFATNNTERMRIDSSGNVGIGVVPSAWGSGYTALQVENAGFVSNGTNFSALASNVYFDGTNYKYINTDEATLFRSIDGQFHFLNAASGTAGTTATLTERMRIDSSGNLLVGTTSSSIAYTTNSGAIIYPDGSHVNSRNGGICGYYNRITSDGDIVVFNKDGTTVGSIGAQGSIYIGANDTNLRFVSGAPDRIVPNSGTGDRDNAIDLGSGSARFDDIYATNGTIQTSDANEKQDIAELDEAEKRVAVAAKGLIRKYRWKDAVAEKGDDARIHVGIIAQDLQAAFAAEGLDAGRYAMFISSTWWEHEGQTYETAEEAPEGATERTRLGVRYPELLAFIIGAM